MSLRTIEILFFLISAAPLAGDGLEREWRAALAQLGYDDLGDLVALLQSNEPKDLRYKAAYLISYDGTKDDALAIERVLYEDTWSERERVSLADKVARLDRKRGVALLLDIEKSLEDPTAHAMALTTLARWGQVPRYDAILEGLSSTDWEQRKEAVKALGLLAATPQAETLDPSPADVLVDLTEDDDTVIRRNAVAQLGPVLMRANEEIRHEMTAALCSRSMKDLDEAIRHQAKTMIDLLSIECETTGSGVKD